MKVTFEYSEGEESFELPDFIEKAIAGLGEYFELTPPEALRYLIAAGHMWVGPRLRVLEAYAKGGERGLDGNSRRDA